MSRHARPEIDRSHWWDRLWRPFWVLPAAICIGSVGLGVLLPTVDEQVISWVPYVFQSGADGARQLLGTIASAMISVTGLVFSVTMVVLQLASSQYTPRLLSTFLASRIAQVTLGVFCGSFLYALTVLRVVRGDLAGAAEFVPQVSVSVAFGYVVASVGCFLAFIGHITDSIRLSSVVSRIGRRTRAAVEALWSGEHPRAGWSPAPGATRTAWTMDDRQGYLTALDSTALIEWGRAHRRVPVLEVGLGHFVVAGQVIGTIWAEDSGGSAGPDGLAEPAPPTEAIKVEDDRVLGADMGFGLRQLTDIAQRALSPGVNDPTTAVQVINELHSILRLLATRDDLWPTLVDDEGAARARWRPQTFRDSAEQSLGEIAHYATDAPAVLTRLAEVIAELESVCRPQHAPALRGLAERVVSAGERPAQR